MDDNILSLEYLDYEVDEELANNRLDKILSLVNSENLSRNQIQNLIEQNYVYVNGKKEKASFKCPYGSKIRMYLKETEESDILPEDIPLDVVFEDDDVIVINKPQGMVVHPAVGHLHGTLVNALIYHCKDMLSSVNGIHRPGIVHRLDKDTSGLIVACKNDNSHHFLAEQLKDKTMHRVYYAIVHGVVGPDEGLIDAPIARHPTHREEMCIRSDGKHAITHFTVLERFSDFTLVKCKLETGRTHQIRVHMAYIGHPVAGDRVYGPTMSIEGNGQYLHAKELAFIHPSTKELTTYVSSLPNDFENSLKILREFGRIDVKRIR